MASLPTVIFQFALSPYKEWQQLAWTGALIITLTVLALSIAARVAGLDEDFEMSVTHDAPVTTAVSPAGRRPRPPVKIAINDLKFFYGDSLAIKGVTLPLHSQFGHGLHRPLGLRQVHAAAHS